MPDLTWFHRDPRFGAADWNCGSGDTAPHATEVSPRPAIAFARRGVYRRHVGSETILVDAGTVAFYPQGMEYRVSHPLSGGDRSLVVTLTGQALESLGVERLPAGYAASFPRIALEVRRVELAARDGASLAVEELLVRLVSEAVTALSGDRRHAPRREATAAAHRRAVERAKEMMASRYGERLTLDDIARESTYSVPHLCEVFRRETGYTIHRYLSRLRLLVALEGLEDPDSLTRLAYQVGFSTPSHFSTAFRREFGHPPSRLVRTLSCLDVARLHGPRRPKSSEDFESGRAPKAR